MPLSHRVLLATAFLPIAGWRPVPVAATTVEALVLRSPTEPVAGAVVELLQVASNEVRSGRGDRFGLVALGEVEPGRYKTRWGEVREGGEVAIAGERAFLIATSVGVEAAVLELRVTGMGEGVTVEVFGRDGEVLRSAVTDQWGEAVTDPLPGGIYRVQAGQDDEVLGEGEVEIGPAMETVEIRPGEGVAGHRALSLWMPEGLLVESVNLLTGVQRTLVSDGTNLELGATGIYLLQVQVEEDRRVVWRGTVAAPGLYPVQLDYVPGEGLREGGAQATPGEDPEEGEDIPAFPWPPPTPSARARLDEELLVADAAEPTLGVAAQRLEAGLDAAGYLDWSWFAVPGGFALVSQLEQIDADGDPLPDEDRWVPELQPVTIVELIRDLTLLFQARPGFFRVVVFVVTDESVTHEGEVSAEEAQAWIPRGAANLPPETAARPFTDNHRATALIYEFEQPTRDHSLALRAPSPTPGREHLEKAGIRLEGE